MDGNGYVNSNYGWQWSRGKQLDYIIEELKSNLQSRRASISIYDAKDRYNFENDTPCTYAINFYILNNKLNMSVMMRSNDLWYGFCNDQYCFSKLQEMISNELKLKVGTYYHFVNNIHIYSNFLNKK
jgi:thymidylate synthase